MSHHLLVIRSGADAASYEGLHANPILPYRAGTNLHIDQVNWRFVETLPGVSTLAHGLTHTGDRTWCNILIHHRFPVHIRGLHKWNTICVCPLGYTVYHLACTMQPRGCIEIGRQLFTFAHVECWKILHIRMLHRIDCVMPANRYIRGPLSLVFLSLYVFITLLIFPEDYWSLSFLYLLYM